MKEKNRKNKIQNETKVWVLQGLDIISQCQHR